MKRLILAGILAVTASVPAQWNASAMGGFGVATVSNPAIAQKLASRFKATGTPVFLIGNPSLGIQQGDILRFQDKAVLVDADVWQTLRSEGALSALKVAPVVRVKAAANPAAWANRAKVVPVGKERRAYELGEQLLRVFQKSFAASPDGQKLFLAFEGGQLVLSAPPGFIEQLKAGKLDAAALGQDNAKLAQNPPRLVSPAPARGFRGREFRWEAWAIDPLGGSTREVKYTLSGTVPPGLVWNADDHSLTGTPMATGRWPLTVRATNNAGSDSLAFVLECAVNQPPRIANQPTAIEPGRRWNFKPVLNDSDHALRELALRVVRKPLGMNFDSLRQEFSWQAPDSLLGKSFPLELCARDPLGDSTCATWSVAVRKPELALSSSGMALHRPWDSLVSGHSYRWNLAGIQGQWKHDGARYQSAWASDSLVASEEWLELLPTRTGTYHLVLRALRDGMTDSVMTSFAVKPDLSPRFVTGLESDSLRYGQSASYRPVAIDPEGDSVSLVAILPPRSPLRWDGKRLILPANVTGRHFAEILAKDAHGNRTIQTIDWVVDPSGKGVFLEGRSESDLGLFTVGTDLRGARIGLFTPSFGRLTGWTERLDMQLPYFFLGVNFFRTREDRLTMDVGLTARSPSKQFYTGGGMARLQGSLTWHAPFAWKSEFDVTGWIDQAMLVADTSGTKDVTLTWANYGANPAWNLNRVQTYKTAWWPVKDKVRRDQIRRDNSVVLTRLDLLGGVKPWLWTGPSWWLDARPLLNQVENFAGWAVKADARLGPMRLTPAGRMGWGFNSGLTMAGSVNLNLGGE